MKNIHNHFTFSFFLFSLLFFSSPQLNSSSAVQDTHFWSEGLQLIKKWIQPGSFISLTSPLHCISRAVSHQYCFFFMELWYIVDTLNLKPKMAAWKQCHHTTSFILQVDFLMAVDCFMQIKTVCMQKLGGYYEFYMHCHEGWFLSSIYWKMMGFVLDFFPKKARTCEHMQNCLYSRKTWGVWDQNILWLRGSHTDIFMIVINPLQENTRTTLRC